MRFSTLFAMSIFALAGPAHSQSATDEVMIGPIDYAQDVNGVSVNVSVKSYVKLATTNNNIYLHVRVAGDLVDLQNKIGAIVDTFNLPSDNCASFSPNNPVVSISKKELRPSGEAAVFAIGGSVTMWHCLENPIPNSKVEWEIKDIGFGIKTKIPVVKKWPGSPIKNKLVTQPFEAELPILLVKNNEHAVGIQFSKPDIELKGDLAFITKGVLKIAGININDKAYDALQKAIDPQKLAVVIPDEIKKYQPSIEAARLTEKDGHLVAEISMSALVPSDTMNALVQELLKK